VFMSYMHYTMAFACLLSCRYVFYASDFVRYIFI